jgi:photosystem II stability/assembly factor-like uncharacterized protein
MNTSWKSIRKMAAAAVLVSGAVWAGPGVWTSSGPDGGWVTALAPSPFNVDEFYALSRGGVFKSIDGGATWFEAGAGLNRQVFQIAHSGTAPNRLIVASSSKVFYSDDGAATWQDRSPPAALLAGSFLSFATGSPLPGTYFIAIGDGRILITEDSGLSWRASPAIPQAGLAGIGAIAADPLAPGELLVATVDFDTPNHSLWRGTMTLPAAPAVWTEITCGGGCPWDLQPIRDLEFGSAGRLWMSNQLQTARSDDAGVTWTIPPAFINRGGESLSVSPINNAVLYLAGGQGLSYTTDDGATLTDVLGGFIGNDLSQPATSTVVVHNPFDPARQIVGTISNGPYRRASVGTDNFVQSSGFRAQNIRAIASNTLNRVHIGVSDSFGATFVAFRSPDNGATWGQVNGGLEADQFRSLVVDPNNPEILYAGGRFDPRNDDLGNLVPGNGGIYKSINGGVTWTTIDNGIPLTSPPFVRSFFQTVRDLAIDPGSVDPVSGNSQVLYAAGTGRIRDDGMGGVAVDAARVYKSTDAGATWLPSDNGVGGFEVGGAGFPLAVAAVQIIVDPTDASGQTLYLATFMTRDSGDQPTTIDNGVFKSIDGGANWVNVTNGLPRIEGNPAAAAQDVLSLAIDPTDVTGGTLYASTNDLVNGTLGSIYKTTDGGLNWAFSGVGLEDRDVRDLVVDPVTGNVYAAVTDPLGNGDNGVFVSEDGGLTWASISTGFPASGAALKLELDNTGSNLLIHAGTTAGLQTFEVLPDGDTDGAPDPIEDDAPPSARGGLPVGDGNGDGVRDAEQTEVASPKVLVGGRGSEITITATVVPATATSGVCDRIENSFGIDQLASVPVERRYDATFNGLYLRIPDCRAAEVTLVYHGRSFSDDPSWQIRSYGLDFPDEERNAWTRVDGAISSGTTWSFVLEDGQRGDGTPGDNIIVFTGAAKQLTERFFSDGMEAE